MPPAVQRRYAGEPDDGVGAQSRPAETRQTGVTRAQGGAERSSLHGPPGHPSAADPDRGSAGPSAHRPCPGGRIHAREQAASAAGFPARAASQQSPRHSRRLADRDIRLDRSHKVTREQPAGPAPGAGLPQRAASLPGCHGGKADSSLARCRRDASFRRQSLSLVSATIAERSAAECKAARFHCVEPRSGGLRSSLGRDTISYAHCILWRQL